MDIKTMLIDSSKCDECGEPTAVLLITLQLFKCGIIALCHTCTQQLMSVINSSMELPKLKSRDNLLQVLTSWVLNLSDEVQSVLTIGDIRKLRDELVKEMNK